MGAAAAIAPALSTIGSAVSAVSAIGGLIGGNDQPEMPQAPQLAPADTRVAENIQEEEASKLRALKRRQANTQNLFRLDDDNSSSGSLLGD